MLYDDLRAGMGGEVGGRFKKEEVYVDIQLIHIIVQQELTQHCKVIIPQLRKKRALGVIGIFQHVQMSSW